MTRFLSRIWDDPACGGFNKDTERLFAYHQATKHTYHSVRANARYLDWHNQPDPFRTYEGVPTISLPPDPGFPNTGTFAAMAALAEKDKTARRGCAGTPRKTFNWILILAQPFSMALDGRQCLEESSGHRRPLQPARESLLRQSASDGNSILLCADLQDWMTAYITIAQTGTPLSFAAAAPGRSNLPVLSKSHGRRSRSLIVGLTSIFWRESWKYGERAYRYCCHDLGHAMMSVLLAARALGLPGGAVAHFSDVSSGPHARPCRKRRSSHGISGLSLAETVRMKFPPRRNSRSGEFQTSYPRKKFAMNCFSGCTLRPSCPTLRDRCRVFPWAIQRLAAATCDLSDPVTGCSTGYRGAAAALGA